MAWCAILWKAIKVRRAFNRLKRAKKNAYREAIGLSPIYPLYERPFRWIWSKLKALALNTCCRCCKPRQGGLPSSWSRLWTKGTLPNEIAKAVLGFIVGTIFSKLMLDFMTSQLNFHAQTVYWSCFLFGIILTFGMTFSDTARCLFILGIPQLFTSKGRAALLAYLLVLALSGPGKNTALNMEVLTESLVCGQNMVKESTQELVSLATAPWSTLKKAVSIIIESLDGVVGRMRKELSEIVDTIYDIINVIKKAYSLLKNVANMCNSKLGTPFDRCMTSFDVASQDCTREMGSSFSWMCSPLDIFRQFCHFAKIPNLVFCWVPSLIKEHIFEPLKEHFKTFANSFTKFFDLKPLKINYDFKHELTQDKTLSDIAKSMKAEIMGHVQWFLDYVDWMDLAISGFMLLVVWKAFTYRYKFLNSDEFDNYYISKEMIRLDLRRKKINKSSIFPLRYRESKVYVQTFSWVLIKEERQQRQLAILFVSIAGVQICNYILMDYLLYSFLELIREYGSIQLDTKEALGFVFSIEGEGFLAEMYRSILRGLSPIGGILPSFDTSKCLPKAHTPNYLQYALILSLLLLAFIIAGMEPYGLRLRHIICGWVYEDRVLKRETWLYQHILSTRDNFMDFVKSQLRAQLKGDRSVFQVSFMDRLAHTMPFCKRLFTTHTKKCFLCGRPGELEDFEYFVECPNCHTVYCKECFEDMGQKCLACMKRINYEELSDFSEEFDSDGDSDEDRDLIEICCSRLCRCISCANKSKSRSQTNSKQKSMPKNKSGTNIRSKNDERYKNIKYMKLPTPKHSPRGGQKSKSKTKSPPIKKTRSRKKIKSLSPQSISPLRKSKTATVGKMKPKSTSQKNRVQKPSRGKGMTMSKQSGMSTIFGSIKGSKLSGLKPGKATMSVSGKTNKSGASTKKIKSRSKSPAMRSSSRTRAFKDVKYQKLGDWSDSSGRNNSSRKTPLKKLPGIITPSSRIISKPNTAGSPRDIKSSSKSTSKRQELVNAKTKIKAHHNSSSPIQKSPILTKRAHSASKQKKPEVEFRQPGNNPSQSRIQSLKSRSQKKSKNTLPKIARHPSPQSPQRRLMDDQRQTRKIRTKQTSTVPQLSHSTSTSPSSTTPDQNSQSMLNFPPPRQELHQDEMHPDANDEHDSYEEYQLERSWWNRYPRTMEKFRHPPRKIAPSVKDRVEYLNTFYQQTPYPPHCNL